MTKEKRLVTTLLSSLFIVVLIATISLGYFIVSNEYNRFDDTIQRHYAEYVEFRKAMLKDEIDIVISNIEFRKEQAEKAGISNIEVFQKDLLSWINNIRLRENQYIVVNKYDGTILAHYKTENIGKNMWGFSDINGVKAVQEAIRVSKQPGGGYITYVGSIRPSTGKPGKKITYARSIPDWQWTIVTGVYLDDIDVAMSQERMEMENNIRKDVVSIVIVLAIMVVISLAIVSLIAYRLRSNFSFLLYFFNEAAKKFEIIKINNLHYLEFQELAESVNDMTRERNTINEKLIRQQEHLEALVQYRTLSLEKLNKQLDEENQQRKASEKEKENLIVELKEALENIKQLSGLLPICANCKKVRDDKGYWSQIETYIQQHSDAEFSHAICPECMEVLYGKESWFKEGKKDRPFM